MVATELDNDSNLERILAEHAGMEGPLLPILHAVQDTVGYISPEHVARIAKALNLSRAEVHGVISFYHYFRQHAPGRHVVQVCRAEACQAMHGEADRAARQARTGRRLRRHQRRRPVHARSGLLPRQLRGRLRR